MANPTIPFPGVNRITAKQELKDVLDLWKRDILLNFNCHHIGTIQQFLPGDAAHAPTVQATINYKKTFYQLNQKTRAYDPVLVDYPMMIEMPVIIMSGGTAALTMPIKQGDECVVLFNDRDIDNWFTSGQTGALLSNRLHSFSDGLALVGAHSNLHPIQNYDTARAVLRNGEAYVGVGIEKILIGNEVTTLNTLLQNLLTQLQNLTSAISISMAGPGTFAVVGSGPVVGASGPPLNAATITTIGATIGTIATEIGGLLE